MLTSIIGYTLTGLFAGFAALMFVGIWMFNDHRQLGALIAFIIFGLLSLGTAHIAGL